MPEPPDAKGPAAPPRAATRGALLPMLLSLAGVLVVVIFAAEQALRNDKPAERPPDNLGGSAPVIAGQVVWPPRDCGDGYLMLRRCRLTGRPYSLYVPGHHVPDRSYPLVVCRQPARQSEVTALELARVWGRLADQHRYLVVAMEDQVRPGAAPASQSATPDSDQGQFQEALAVLSDMLTDFHVDPDGVLLCEGETAFSLGCRLGGCYDALTAMRGRLSAELLDVLESDNLPLFAFDIPASNRSAGDAEKPEAAVARLFDEELAGLDPPIRIILTPERRPAAPIRVTIAPMVSVRAGKVRRYRWDFGTLASTISYQKSHQILIRKDGSYPIGLTVTDERGGEHRCQAALTVPSGQGQGE